MLAPGFHLIIALSLRRSVRMLWRMHLENYGYSAALVLVAMSSLALTVPDDSRHLSALMTLSLITSFLLVLWTLLHDR